MSKSTPPEPIRKRVMLVSDGYKTQKKFTAHHYVGTKPVAIQGAPYWSFEFKCFETGAVRRYGLADRIELSGQELVEDIEREGN